MSVKAYKPQDFSKVRGLAGISNDQIEEHLKLYEGYVKRVNALTEKLEALAKDGKASGADPVYAELTRRLGFEYGGVVNHEYYFGNLTAGAQAEPPAGSKLAKAIEASFGSISTYLADFKAIATMPGIGWAMTFQDPNTGWLSNQFVTLHENGVPPGFRVVVALDGWEHAFMRDYKAFERGKYVEAFFKNVDWAAVESRLK
ncbi:MAG: Fe-Mn family superoxide dismutase [Anaeromyxobacteraceae bacterium]